MICGNFWIRFVYIFGVNLWKVLASIGGHFWPRFVAISGHNLWLFLATKFHNFCQVKLKMNTKRWLKMDTNLRPKMNAKVEILLWRPFLVPDSCPFLSTVLCSFLISPHRGCKILWPEMTTNCGQKLLLIVARNGDKLWPKIATTCGQK